MGLRLRAEIKGEVAIAAAAMIARGVRPGLAVILVGSVAASEIYVRSKVKTCAELGLYSEMLTPPESVTTEELLRLVAELNAREEIDGILIQLPLPAHVDTKRLLEAVAPEKDVDGFHPVNVGRLQSGQPGLQPCTPAGVMEMLRRREIPVAGRNAVVIGRSDIVGKPMAMLLLNASATVTVCHSKTVEPGAVYARGGHSGGGDWTAGVCDGGDGEAGSGAGGCGDQSGDGCGRGAAVLRGRCGPGGYISEAGIGGGGRYRSGGVRGERGVYAGAGRRGSADDCDADGEHGEGGDAAAGRL